MIRILITFLILSSEVFAGECMEEVQISYRGQANITRTRSYDWTELEKKMIFQMVTKVGPWKKVRSQAQAIQIFENPTNAVVENVTGGVIRYIKVGRTKLAYVTFWPEDREYGAYFQLFSPDNAKMVGLVDDNSLSCK
jgi:hypothetical protein